MTVFSHEFLVGWAEVDFNAHMRNSAFLDHASDTRMLFFASVGLGVAELERLRLGPIVKSDQVEYFRELRLVERFRVTHQVAGLAPDCSRYRIRNEFFRCRDDLLAARVTSTGGYIDLDRRKLVAPPEHVREVLRAVSRTEDFAELPSSLK